MYFQAAVALLVATQAGVALANPAPAPTQPTGTALASAQISFISAIANYEATLTTGSAYKSEISVLNTNSAWSTVTGYPELADPSRGFPFSDPGAVYTSISKVYDSLPTDAGGRQFLQNGIYDEFSIYQSAFQTTFLGKKNAGGPAATPAPVLKMAGAAVGVFGAVVAAL